jgi:hypothetical protein
MPPKRDNAKRAGWGSDSHTAFSDFAHLPTPALVDYCELLLGPFG